MKKLLIVLMAASLLLVCCGVDDRYKENVNNDSSEETFSKISSENDSVEYIDGFEVAEYDKFNSYAYENGLDGTMICIEGKVIAQTNIHSDGQDIPILVIVVEQTDGNRWSVMVRSESGLDDIEERKIRVFGTYGGFSDLMNLPALFVLIDSGDPDEMKKMRIEMLEDEDYKEVWNYYSDYIEPELEKLDKQEGSTDTGEYEDEGQPTIVETEPQTTQESEPQSTETEITVTIGMKNALKSARQYIDIMAFSYEGLIDQLEYDKYSHEEAIYAADNCGADWDKQALKSAKNYLSVMAFSYDGLIGQLEYDKFTSDQSKYAADNCGADWNEQAAKSAKNYINIMSFSRDGLIEQLEFDGFTHEQAVYGAEQNGY